MNSTLLWLCAALFCLHLSLAQEQREPAVRTTLPDAVSQNQSRKGNSLQEGEVTINPLAPSKAAFYSAILPGLGQIYNKRYWKIPILYAALGTSLYIYADRNAEYNQVRAAFKRRLAGFTDDEFFDLNGDGVGPDVSSAALQNAQDNLQKDRDLALIISIAFYVLNIIDANVDAHLKQYNISEKLAMDVTPNVDINPLNHTPKYGMKLVLAF